MTRKEYLSALEQYLVTMSASEKADIISDYEQHFRLGLENGKTESQIAASLGSPYDVANQFLEGKRPQAPTYPNHPRTQTAGTSAQRTQTAGASAQRTQTAGASAQRTQTAGTSAQRTQTAGASAQRTQTAGTSAQRTQTAGTSAQRTQTAGTSAQRTQTAGTSAQRTQTAGTSAQRTQTAGTYTQRTQTAGTSAYTSQTYQQPTYQQPTYQQQAYQQPTYQQPAYQQPTYQQPTYQQPTYQQPTYQQQAYQRAYDDGYVDYDRAAAEPSDTQEKKRKDSPINTTGLIIVIVLCVLLIPTVGATIVGLLIGLYGLIMAFPAGGVALIAAGGALSATSIWICLGLIFLGISFLALTGLLVMAAIEGTKLVVRLLRYVIKECKKMILEGSF